jgi:hypothetical protein
MGIPQTVAAETILARTQTEGIKYIVGSGHPPGTNNIPGGTHSNIIE